MCSMYMDSHGRLRSQSRDKYLVFVTSLCLCVMLSGCAALTNPVANGIPVRLVPPELLAESKEHKETIPLTYLRRQPPRGYSLDARDVLGVYIETILGNPNVAPPVTFSDISDLPPALGYPIPVRDDGTISLPQVGSISVRGLSVAEAEQKIIEAYTTQGDIIRPGKERIVVTLLRPRHTRVMVVRQDAPSENVRIRGRGRLRGNRVVLGSEFLSSTRQGTGMIVDLPPNENDVLHALTLSGGLPGLDAANEVIIQRGYAGEMLSIPENPELLRLPPAADDPALPGEGRIVRIPLRLFPGEPPPFLPEDIILRDGDIVFIESRDSEVFYAGGLLPSGEYPLPRDYDLDVLEALALIGGPVINGGINANNLSGQLVSPGLGNPSPRLVSVIRKTPDGRQVTIEVDIFLAARDPDENLVLKAGDYLVLQETKAQAIARYITQVFQFRLISDVISRTDTTGTTSLFVPNLFVP